MDYRSIYDKMIENRRMAIPIGYSEKHHITPRSLGGLDDESNIVRLTAREHFIAHLLLMKFNPCRETIYAAFMMANCGDAKQIGRVKICQKSRTYEILKSAYAIELSKIHKGKTLSAETRNKISVSLKGKLKTKETKERMSASAKELFVKNPDRGKNIGKKLVGIVRSDETKQKIKDRVFTDEWRKNIGDSSRGRVHSLETIEKINSHHRGRKNSEETIRKMKEAATKRWANRKAGS